MSLDQAEPSNRRAPLLSLMVLMTALGVFPLDVILPSFPALSEHFSAPASNIAYSVSLFAVGVALSQLALGPLSDRFGRKNVLLAGLFVASIGSIGCIYSNDFQIYMTFRLVQAIGCGSFVISHAIIQDTFTPQHRNSARILLTTTSGVFISLSPLLGSILQSHWNWPGSFFTFAILSALAICFSALLLKNSPDSVSTTEAGIISTYQKILMNPRFSVYSSISGITFACHFSFIVVSPILFMDTLGLSANQFGLTFMLYGFAYMCGGAFAGLVHRHMTPLQQMTLGLILIVGSGSILWILSHHPLTPYTLIIPMIICTAGTTITRPAATSLALELNPAAAGASASLLNTFVFAIGGVISSIIAHFINHLSVTLALSFAGLGILGLLLIRVLPKEQDDKLHPSEDRL
ncbi:MFS transporter [Pseudomonas sp. R5(2019)]|uniref:MFS transporter n=1 Tax=Pseudomonas sp. R5(2019) TaxID=2697566 RepID=UPI001411EBAC|nr:MFS transporter [Pseudomonas sp. R5(2019)]NBA94051.1 MFS transporter [Pseudomonas sp. R5(2019)]